MVEDRVQDLNSNQNSKTQDKAKLNKRTIEIVLNELFVLDTRTKMKKQYDNMLETWELL